MSQRNRATLHITVLRNVLRIRMNQQSVIYRVTLIVFIATVSFPILTLDDLE